jgi:hypothetical protein
MGVVYRARQAGLDRVVALKILTRDREADPRFAERFAREARALARLNHPNIVTIHDFGETGGLCYLLMELVDGLSLRQLLQSGQLSPETGLAVVPRICEALQYAHEQGVVHRDIKPENILLDRKGRVKIADFGIARIVGSDTSGARLTEATQVIGTPHYMAPEQVERPLIVDHRADIYSLGVVFYEMLTGELPLGKFQPPSRRAELDVRLDEVVLRALEKEPERRYQRASEMRDDVEMISAGTARATAPSLEPDPCDPLRIRRNAGLACGLIVSLAAFLAGLALQLPFVASLSLLGIAITGLKLTGRWPCSFWLDRNARQQDQRPTGSMSAVAAFALLLLPFLFFASYLSGTDLDADVRFWTGVAGFPLSAAIGLLLAALYRGQVPKEAQPHGPRWPRNWQAIVAATLFALSLPMAGGLFVMSQLITQDSQWNPGAAEAAAVLLMLCGAAGGFLGAILFAIAAFRSKVRRPETPFGIAPASTSPGETFTDRALSPARWTARILGTTALAVILPIVLAEGVPPVFRQPAGAQLSVSGALLIIAGLGFGWWRDGIAALLITTGWTLRAVAQTDLRFEILHMVMAIAALFGFCWWASQGRRTGIIAGVAGTALAALFLGRLFIPVSVVVTGIVADASSGRAIAGAALTLVSVRSPAPRARTDSRGWFDLHVGWYKPSLQVRISAPGFSSLVTNLGPRAIGKRRLGRGYLLQPEPAP